MKHVDTDGVEIVYNTREALEPKVVFNKEGDRRPVPDKVVRLAVISITKTVVWQLTEKGPEEFPSAYPIRSCTLQSLARRSPASSVRQTAASC